MNQLLPGFLVALVVAVSGKFLAEFLSSLVNGGTKGAVSSITAAVILGLALANGFKLPPRLAPGLKFCARTVLRLGIVLLGLRLSIARSTIDSAYRGVSGL
jgi:uncharacterized membrane protein YadS